MEQGNSKLKIQEDEEGLKNNAESGGRVISIENGWPCQGISSALTPELLSNLVSEALLTRRLGPWFFLRSHQYSECRR